MRSTARKLLEAGMLAAVVAFPRTARPQTATPSFAVPTVSVTVQDADNPYARLSASPGSYVIVFKVSDDKRVRILFPASPAKQTPFPAGPGFFPLPLDIPAFSMGVVYAAASDIPFNFSSIANAEGWNGNALILRRSRDPEEAASRALRMITPAEAAVTIAEAGYVGRGTASTLGLGKRDQQSLFLGELTRFALRSNDSGVRMSAPRDPWAAPRMSGTTSGASGNPRPKPSGRLR